MKLFISYRRNDAAAITGRIFDRLSSHFGSAAIFMDVDSVPFGADFRRYIRDAITQCGVMVAVIGKEWLQLSEDGKSKLEDPADFVRVEIEIALQEGIPIIPVLVDRVAMPKPAQLPESISDLAFRNAAGVDTGRDFHVHMDRLIHQVDQLAEQRYRLPNREERSDSIKPSTKWLSWLGEKASTHGNLTRNQQQSKLARYTLFFWPKSVIGWISRVVFAWSFIGTIVFLIMTFTEAPGRDVIRSLGILATIAALSYMITVRDGRPRKPAGS